VTLARVLAAAVMFAGLAVRMAIPAEAADPIDGVYVYHQDGVPPLQWSIYSTCVRDGCVLHITNSKFAGDARNVSDLWSLTVPLKDGVKCPDGTTGPSTNTYAFDDATLTGTVTVTHNTVCGMQPDVTKMPFTLSFQSPLSIPVDRYPYTCDQTDPPCFREDY
jgi:hypothetical protein